MNLPAVDLKWNWSCQKERKETKLCASLSNPADGTVFVWRIFLYIANIAKR